MTAPATSADAQAYLAAVRAELADLAEPDRYELLEDLAMHLAAIEEERDERPLQVRLGPAAAYAEELRVAAGLPPRPRSDHGVAGQLRSIALRTRQTRWLREATAFVPQLLPAWWVARGYLLVLLPALVRVTSARDFPVPAPAGSHALGLLLVAVAVVLSVLIGRRRLPRLVVPLVLVVDVVLAVVALDVLASAPERLTVHETRVVAAANPFAESPLMTGHGPVTDIYPYTLDGKPLTDVLLYDQDGRPLETGRQLWWRDHCRRVLAQPKAVDGIPVPQVYPKHYELDPAAVTLSGLPIAPGQCTVVTRPVVAVPTLAPSIPRPGPAR